ncbi:NAD-glutamate dehydrogenase [Microlunatus speluncae]|uniref:NAD-glutamate dehydrogenase n=1 Tax=Microlunatus speluncae TaxID=2594267 RepID=UPI00126687A6|nr:NAD-glutamate dehydrogenase [Microlunatus speluncae]
MTTFEVELEREKSAKIERLAERGAAIAAKFGHDAEAVKHFLTHYFRHVDAADIDERATEDLLGLVVSHFRLATERPPSRASIAVRTPSQTDDGWTTGGTTVVQIVTDDRPFLVDSVTMEVLRQGWSIREVFHPQFTVRRTLAGDLIDIVRESEAGNDPSVIAESWMHLEILPPPPAEQDGDPVDRLTDGLHEVLRLVDESVSDWRKMVQRSTETIAMLSGLDEDDHPEAARARELLQWLNDGQFSFLGYREYEYVRGDQATYRPVPATGLGILRADTDAPDTFHALPLAGRGRPALMVITKDDHRSRVHRPAYLDYIGIRTFADDGTVTGERRFLGLFASTAYSEAVTRVPVLRQKAKEILRRSGYHPDSHGGKAIMDVLDSYPRDELFQASVAELYQIVEKVAHLKERRQVRLFVRRDSYGRYVSFLVYLPRDRYTTAVRSRMQQVLINTFDGEQIDYTARVSESVLARLHFVMRMRVGTTVGEIDVRSLERELTAATRSWNDEFADQLVTTEAQQTLATLVGALPEGYKEEYEPRQAIMDLGALAAIDPEIGMSMVVYAPDKADDPADLRLKIFRLDPLSLTKVLPHLSVLGVDVVDERPFELQLAGDQRAFIYDFGLTIPGGREQRVHWSREARHRFTDAFAASYLAESEYDGFNALVMGAELTWQQVAVLRAIGRYLRQAGAPYSQAYIARALAANVDLARTLSRLFEAKFGLAGDDDHAPGDQGKGAAKRRKATVTELTEQVTTALNDVASLDHDRIIRSYLAVIGAMIRTNAFQPNRAALAFKLLPRQIEDLPEPRPAYEIFVYSPRLEGLHLRFGAVARGGLRWSDRAEDFRTEILGLVKAQMVKNAVIVPVGAKGGFVCKRLPDPSNRDAWLEEGTACYRLFISSLLDLTDNIVDGVVVPPRDVIRYDEDDPYLVVAADKGTATFSDVANAISVDRGFWLGDAFASGGSAGYDHKAMGITARGAWESVRRHFREMGIDCQAEEFTVVGIGDMSGDVFGNGMLLSRKIKLIAAFDHRHIFIDPTPDPETGFVERERLFGLPRSSWADYDQSLISAGGGIYPRTMKSITITPELRAAIGLDKKIEKLTPSELINACLKAPVDLLWNGGIGTYVKATAETNAQVGDKANDGLRVNGAELRARCVGEGGNLGLTQLGRIEYASTKISRSEEYGRINTDFIDNTAGVDTSDHEVNIKILLQAEIAAGRLSESDRDSLLASMTDEVAELVLTHNIEQNLALANGVYQSYAMAGVHEDWMERLADGGHLDREIEFLPGTEEMAQRRGDKRGLTAPELSVLMAYSKIVLEDQIIASDLPDDPYLNQRLVGYFPTALRQRYADQMPDHRLHREIVATVVVNDFVNISGTTCYHRLSAETGAEAADLIRAQIAARSIFAADDLRRGIAELDHTVDAAIQTALRLEVRTLVERGTRWLVNNRRRPVDISAAVAQLAEGVSAVTAALPELLADRELKAYRDRMGGYTAAGVPEQLASAIAALPAAYGALTVVQTARRDDHDLMRVARVHFLVAQRLGLDRLLAQIIRLPRSDRWQTMARAALRDDLHTVHAQLTALVLGDGEPESLVEEWERTNPSVREVVRELRLVTEGRSDLARMSVGLRLVRSLLPADE